MKLSQKIVSGFLIVTVIMGGFGFFMFTRVSSQLSDKQNEVNDLSALTSSIQDFHIENFHTQLEVWEYAYQPNEKRLNAFYKHLVVFDVLFDEFVALADGAALDPEARAIVTELQIGIVDVRGSWIDFVARSAELATGTLTTATLADDGSEKYPLLDGMQAYGYQYSYPMFDPASVDAFEPALISQMAGPGGIEEIFDDANFNSNTDRFVVLQQTALAATVAEMSDLKSSLTSQFIIAFVVVLGLAAGLAVLLTNVITKPIKQVTEAACELGSGNVNVAIPQVTSNDEIQDLAETMVVVTDAVRFLQGEVRDAQGVEEDAA